MTRLELLLALDAVLTAAESRLSFEDKTDLVDVLAGEKAREAIDKEINAAYPVFDDFLTAQRAAVEKLAADPQVWGG